VLAARLHAVGDLRVGEEPGPEAGPGMSLVRVTAVGICGSDLHWWGEGAIGDDVLSHPLVLGHEGAGVIAAGPRRGERVAIDPAIVCGVCRACRDGYENLCYRIRFAGHGETDGMMREFMAWPSALLHPLPDGVSDASGAVLEPLGVAVHSMDLGHLPFGGTACVVGCGPIGLLLVGVLKAAGASSVLAVEPLEHRRKAASRFGADVVAEPGWPDLAAVGVDVAFEAAGTDEAIGLALESVRPGGRVVLAGIPGDDAIGFRASLARRKGLTIAMVRRMNRVYPRAISLAARGVVDLGSLVSSRASLGNAAKAFGQAASRTGLKVIIEPLRCGSCVRSGWRRCSTAAASWRSFSSAVRLTPAARAWPGSRRRRGRSWPGLVADGWRHGPGGGRSRCGPPASGRGSARPGWGWSSAS
jgi:L-iditol 2-dehydrogenase